MADFAISNGREARSTVEISSTAANMLSSLYGRSSAKVKAAIDNIKSDIDDPAKVTKILGYDDVFVARGHGMRVIFTRRGASSVITSVSAEG